jgi:hypothetical protein
LSGLKRLFSAQVVAELVKAIMKTALMGSVAAFYLWHKWPEIMRLMMEAPVTAMASAESGRDVLPVGRAVDNPDGGVRRLLADLQPPEKIAHVQTGYP